MIDTIESLVKDFMPFAQKRMGFKNPPRLFLKKDASNAGNPLGRTAFYDPQESSVTLYITNRHPKDIMRSLSHELVHHTQNCRGDFNNIDEMGEGYAQNDEHLREMEREAYEKGNMCFRDWEDSVKYTIKYEHLQKGDKKMSIKDWKNKEVRGLLAEAWGFKFNTLQEFDEFNGSGEVQEEIADVDESADAEVQEEGGAAARTGNEEKDAGRDRLHADRVHEEADYGGNKDDKSKTHKGEKDDTTKKGDKLKDTEDGGKRGEKPGDKADVNEAEVQEEGEKPDFLDVDKDGDKEESMKDAAADKNEAVEHLQEAIAKMLRKHLRG